MKKKILTIVVIVVLMLCFLLILPWGRSIRIQTTAYEFALDEKEPLAEHEIAIEGRYTRRLFREDVFSGSMVISGYPETDGASVYIQFWKDHAFGTVSYQQNGIPVWDTELEQMYANGDFSEFVIQLFDVSQEGDKIQSTWSGESGRLLCSASDYAGMTEVCAELGLPVMAEGE